MDTTGVDGVDTLGVDGVELPGLPVSNYDDNSNDDSDSDKHHSIQTHSGQTIQSTQDPEYVYTTNIRYDTLFL